MPAAAARAAATAWVGDAHAAARLITAVERTGSSTRLDAGLQLRLAPGWHTYWRTPGDAGFAPSIDWKGSDNLATATIAWPAPKRLVTAGLQNFVYEHGVVLPLAIRLAQPGQALRLHAEVDYAACAEVCVPYHASLSLALPPGLATPGPEAPLIAAAHAQVPGSLGSVGLRLVSATAAKTKRGAVLAVTVASDAGPLQAPDLFVEGVRGTSPGRPRLEQSIGGRRATLVVPVDTVPITAIAGKALTFTLVDGVRAAAFTAAPVLGAAPAETGAGGWLAILGIALLGGLILNAMPCVLPVLSLKLLSVAGYAGAERRRVRLGLLATAAGVVVSFLVLAGALIALKLTGAAIGWGIQFQQPLFLAAMALVMALFAASLWGWMPVALPGLAAGAGSIRSSRPALDAFLAGVFATLMAASCSAPFVGTAVGFALTRGPADILLVFAALGIGMASPLLAIAAMPGVVRALPKPGSWMIWLERVLGVALAGTSAWLLWVLAQVAGLAAALTGAAALVGLLAVLALRRRGGGFRGGTAAVVALAGIAVLVPDLLLTAPAVPAVAAAGPWQPFDRAAITGLVSRGKLVFVDVTAAWCLTCKVNEITVLDRPPVRDRLRAPGLVAMRADWTRPSPAVTDYLQSFGRYGVPLDVVYGLGAPHGIALPELLTSGTVMDALRQTAGPAHRQDAAREAAK